MRNHPVLQHRAPDVEVMEHMVSHAHSLTRRASDMVVYQQHPDVADVGR